jgi:hypothetical protein
MYFIDFVSSFDSIKEAEMSFIHVYETQLLRILKLGFFSFALLSLYPLSEQLMKNEAGESQSSRPALATLGGCVSKKGKKSL